MPFSFPIAKRQRRASRNPFPNRGEQTNWRASSPTHPFRIQFLGAARDRGPTTLKEVEIQVADVSTAIIAAANLEWPPRTIGLRILDREGREIFGRQKADRR
jgi:hypothetical protein